MVIVSPLTGVVGPLANGRTPWLITGGDPNYLRSGGPSSKQKNPPKKHTLTDGHGKVGKVHLMVAALASLVCSASSPTIAPGFSWTTPQDDKGGRSSATAPLGFCWLMLVVEDL